MGKAPEYEFLHYVLTNLLDEPEQMELRHSVDDLGVLLEVRVAEEDMGKLIGKGGQTVKALRVLLRLIGSKTNSRINLKVLDPETE